MDFKHFIGGSYESQAPMADQEQTINWYPEVLESPGATREAVLLPTPGVEVLDTALDGAGRGHISINGREFAWIGDFFYEIDAAGLLTSRGVYNAASQTSNSPATIDSNGAGGNQLFQTIFGQGLVYDLSTNFNTPIATLAGRADMGGYLDSYFLCLDRNTSTLFISNSFDGSVWDTGTDFAQRSLAADPWLSMKVNGRYIWLFGEYTTEIWQNTGENFPFAPIPNATLDWGIAAQYSVANVDDDIVWLGKNQSGKICVLRGQGVNPQVISTQALEHILEGYTNAAIRNAVADSYAESGHSFYILNFDDAGATHVWDAKTGLWHRRGTWNPVTGEFGSWRPRFHAYRANQHRMLDSLATFSPAEWGSGTIPSPVYRVENTLTEEVGGGVIRRVRRAPALQSENRRVFYSKFELDLEPGLGLESGQGEDPQVMMRMSNDGGKTWGSELWRSAGKIGEYENRARWLRLGSGRRRVFEVSVTDPIPWRVTGAYIDSLSEGTRG